MVPRPRPRKRGVGALRAERSAPAPSSWGARAARREGWCAANGGVLVASRLRASRAPAAPPQPDGRGFQVPGSPGQARGWGR